MTLGTLAVVGLLVARAVPRIASSRAAYIRARSLVTRPSQPSATGRMPAALSAAGIPWSARQVRNAWLSGFALAAGLAIVAGPVAGLFMALVVAFGPAVILWRRRHHAVERIDAELPAALDAVVRALRAGLPLDNALTSASSAITGPLAHELAGTAAAIPMSGAASALEAWAASRRTAAVRLVVAALVLGVESGGAQARAIEGVAATLRARLALAAEVRSLSSQARLSAAVIAVAPVAFMAVASVTDPRIADLLFRTRLGAVLLAGGLMLDGAGALWMAAICRAAPRPTELPEIVDLFSVALSAGLTVRLATEAVASRASDTPVATELRRVLAESNSGRRLADALDDLPARAGEETRPLAAALAASERYGTPVAPALDRLATDVRDEQRRKAEELARRVPVRLLFPLVCCVLPAFGLLTVGPVLAGAVSSLGL